jgi:hypothetical protein
MITLRNLQFPAILALVVGLSVAPFANSPVAGCAVTSAAATISGLDPQKRHAVHQAVDLIREGDYALAYLRLGAAAPATTLTAKSRVLSAFTLLLAGDGLGAFPPRACPS